MYYEYRGCIEGGALSCGLGTIPVANPIRKASGLIRRDKGVNYVKFNKYGNTERNIKIN